jgi:predicted kinase
MLTKFKKFLEEFKESKLWQNMETTVENSPWHREANVAVHTQMILDHYEQNFIESRTPRQQAITLLSILFHDTGKPAARTQKTSETRGTYFGFGGHEAISARIWEDYAIENWNKWKQLKNTFGLVDTDIYVIAWIIENHLPHNFKSTDDFANIAAQLRSAPFEGGALAESYFDQIICDQAGRIADNQEKNMAEVVEFVDEIRLHLAAAEIDALFVDAKDAEDQPIICILVGASGSGKSTYSDALRKQGYKYFSLDASRIEYAKENGVRGSNPIDVYGRAHAYCDKHRGPFRLYADRVFSDLVKAREDIIIDNTNVGRKARDNYSKFARKNGYKVVCAMFPITKSELLKRQKVRKDKTVPIVAVLDQYKRIAMPWISDECDAIDMVMSNVTGE